MLVTGAGRRTYISGNHPNTSLQALQRQVLLNRTAMNLELGIKARRLDNKLLLRLIRLVYVEVNMVATDGLGKLLGTSTGFSRALLAHAHVDGGENLVAELLGSLGKFAFLAVLADALDILNDLLVAVFDGLDDDAAHGEDEGRRGARVDTSA